MRDNKLMKYVMDKDIYFDDNEGLKIFYYEHSVENIFEIVNNELRIKECIKKEYGLTDNDGLKAIVFSAFEFINWEEEYIISGWANDNIEYTVFIGRDIDEEDYYAIKVRTGVMNEYDSDGNGGTYTYQVADPFNDAIEWYKDDLEGNKEYVFKRLQRLQDIIRDEIIKFKEKPKFRKYIDYEGDYEFDCVCDFDI